jgi:hypothetical protein
VAQDVDGDVFAFQDGQRLAAALASRANKVMHAVGAETRASGIGEQNLPVTAWGFAEPSFPARRPWVWRAVHNVPCGPSRSHEHEHPYRA